LSSVGVVPLEVISRDLPGDFPISPGRYSRIPVAHSPRRDGLYEITQDNVKIAACWQTPQTALRNTAEATLITVIETRRKRHEIAIVDDRSIAQQELSIILARIKLFGATTHAKKSRSLPGLLREQTGPSPRAGDTTDTGQFSQDPHPGTPRVRPGNSPTSSG